MHKTSGVLLITIGIILMLWAGLNFSMPEKTKKKAPIHVLDEPDKALDWPFLSGGFLFAGGIAIIIMSKREHRGW